MSAQWPEHGVEVWCGSFSIPRWSARQGAIVEELGFDGITVSDSQCMAADPYVTMMAIVANTTTLRVAPSVTNPITRVAGSTACAIASIQAESKGRAALGIGRGDSALAHIGYAPASVAFFEQYVATVQAFLRGEEVAFAGSPLLEGLKSVDTLGLTGAPTSSRLEWLKPEIPKVEVMVAASGPKVIRAAARTADCINFALGADPKRIEWAIGEAKAARADVGLDPDSIRFGAYVSVVPEGDREEARRIIAGDVASFARFSVMHGKTVGPTTSERESILSEIHRSYDMAEHFRETSPQAQSLTADFIDSFAIVGPPSYCVDRLLELVDSGVTRFIASTGMRSSDRSEGDRLRDVFAREVLPKVRSGR